MDLELTDEQLASVELTRSMVSRRFALDRVRRFEETDVVLDGDDWQALAEAGMFSLTIPEEAGGAGLGLVDAALIFAELGRGLVPGPLVGTFMAATLGARLASSGLELDVDEARALAGAADGAARVALVRRPLPGSAGGGVLIEHLTEAAAVLVLEPDDGLTVVAADDLPVAVSAVGLDPLTPESLVEFLPTGTALDPAVAGPWLREARVLTSALLVGIAGATCDLAVAYAKVRHQFGRPIGSFQAVKHLCADMLVRAELARAAVDVAALSADQPDTGDPDRAAASAALVAADGALANAKSCVQVHGGMGFTWEVPAHLYVMRARVLGASLGSSDRLAREVASRW